MKNKNTFFLLNAFVIGFSLLMSVSSRADNWGADGNANPSSSDRNQAYGSLWNNSNNTNSQPKRNTTPKAPGTTKNDNSNVKSDCVETPYGCVPKADSSSVNTDTPAKQGNSTTKSSGTATDAECRKFLDQQNQLYTECSSKSAEALANCDSDKDSGMNQAIGGLSSMAVGAGVQSACTALGQALGAVNGAVAAFTEVCSSAKTSCVNKCDAIRKNLEKSGEKLCKDTTFENEKDSLYARVDSDNNKCKALDSKVQQGVAAANNTMNTVKGAMSCASQVDTTLLYCKQNPTALGCSGASADCSNPAIASSNPICICTANPNDPSCGVAVKAGTGFGSSDLSSSAGLTGGAGTGVDTGLDDTSWKGGDWKKGNDLAEDPGGSKGGRPIQNGSSGSSGGSEGAAPAAVAAANVNSGFRGGGNGSGGSGFYSGSGGDGSNPAAAATKEPGSPDLRNFLPGGKFDPKSRGIAGISGPDGITGPHTNIWQKIQNRYQSESPKLMP